MFNKDFYTIQCSNSGEPHSALRESDTFTSFWRLEKKEVIDAPRAKVLPQNSATVDPAVKEKLDKLLSLKSFQPPEYGENGVGVALPAEMTEEKDKRFLENQFNVIASEMISINRSLPDYRSAESPLALLEEIILIDDLSDRDYLKAPLDEYIKRFPVPMRIVHLKRRSGLIRARLTGSGMAKGRVLLFLDAHVE
ncbi:hypothetical protein TELCIR_14501, partial [Teladorsagia circumcincta]